MAGLSSAARVVEHTTKQIVVDASNFESSTCARCGSSIIAEPDAQRQRPAATGALRTATRHRLWVKMYVV